MMELVYFEIPDDKDLRTRWAIQSKLQSLDRMICDGDRYPD